MKNLLLILAIFSAAAFGHEGGHGELKESGKFGGVTAPVVDDLQSGLGKKATLLYKAEFVRTEAGKISLYVFDKDMKLIDLSAFDDKVLAKLEVKKKGKFSYFGEFNLVKNGNHFHGQLPAVEHKPFNVDVYIMKGSQKLFVGFANLD